MIVVAVLVALVSSAAALRPPWEFSWDRVSTWCFPGCVPNALFDDAHSHAFARFSAVDYWGLNTSCDDGPALIDNTSHMGCPSRPNRWVPNVEYALLEQAARFRAINPQALAFPYIFWGASQLWYSHGAEFNRDAHESWWVRLPDGSPVDCRTNADCNFQGSEARIYDFTQAEVREFFKRDVLGPFLDSPNVSGVFFDEFGLFTFRIGPNAGVDPAYLARRQNATLLLLQEVCELMREKGKVPILSVQDEVARHADFYERTLATLEIYGGMRFWEFWAGTLEHVRMLMDLSAKHVPVQAHAPFSKGEAPDYKLATFLLAAGEYSYFSWGLQYDWTPDGFPWIPEFEKPLGRPASDGAITAVRLPLAKVVALSGKSAVVGVVPHPGESTDKAKFVGKFWSFDQCLKAVAESAHAGSALAVTWTTAAQWERDCYAMVGDCSREMPAMADDQHATSAFLCSVTGTRRFEHLSLFVDFAKGSAKLDWF